MVARRPRRRSIRLVIGSATHVGRIRDVNQDDVASGDDVYVVADGMGGHRGGEVASTVATSAVVEGFTGPDRASLVRAVRLANRAVLERAAADPELSGMGTTLCALAVVDGPGGQGGPDALAVVNIGDSRVYRLDAGGLVRVSDDHSLVADLVRAGELTPDEAAVHNATFSPGLWGSKPIPPSTVGNSRRPWETASCCAVTGCSTSWMMPGSANFWATARPTR